MFLAAQLAEQVAVIVLGDGGGDGGRGLPLGIEAEGVGAGGEHGGEGRLEAGAGGAEYVPSRTIRATPAV